MFNIDFDQDVSDFLTSHEEERQLAKALKESLKDLKKNDAVASTNRTAPKNCVTEPKETSVSRSSKDPPPPLEAVLTRPKRDAAQRASVSRPSSWDTKLMRTKHSVYFSGYYRFIVF